MRTTNFIHMSDLHILKVYEDVMLSQMNQKLGKTPIESLQTVSACIAHNYPDIDFILITGDLVHEGGEADYVYLKELLAQYFQVPVHVCIGNHDRISAFRAGYLGETPSSKPYYYEQWLGDSEVRLIVLDSSYDNSGIGTIDNEQLAWLDNLLENCAEGGSIVAIHHPPCIIEAEGILNHSLTNSQALYNILAGSDIFAILSGHMHQNTATVLGEIPHYTVDSTAFGVRIDSKFMSFNDTLGFNYCTINNQQLSVCHETASVQSTTGFEIAIQDLLKHMHPEMSDLQVESETTK